MTLPNLLANDLDSQEMCLALSVTFANELASICEKVGADAKQVELGLKTDIRIGKKAYLGPGGPFAGGTLARDIKFLESILLTLRKNGFLGSKKGKGGGYYLMQDPKEIKMTSIMRVLEGPISMVPCVSLNFYEKCDDCPDENTCGVHRLMEEVRDNTLAIFKNRRLSDLCNS